MSIDRWMDKDVVYLYNGILTIKKNEFESVLVRWTEWSKSEREKQISYINTHIWNLEKLYWLTYFQGRNGDADIENGLVDMVGAEEKGTYGESSISMYTLSGVWRTAGEKMLCSRRIPAWALWWPGGMGWGGEGGMVRRVIMADSHCCFAETNTTL